MNATIDKFLEAANDPELTEAVNQLLLVFNLRLLANADYKRGQIGPKRIEKIARQLAVKESEGDTGLEDDLYRILIASLHD